MAVITVRAPTTSGSVSGISITADVRALTRLANDLRRAAPQALKAAQASIRAVATAVKDEAAANASWSTRIPSSGKVRMKGFNARVIFGGPQAPEAAPLENKGQSGTFRHPVFGNRQNWVNQKARPFLWPAFAAHQETALKTIEQAVFDAVDAAIRGV